MTRRFFPARTPQQIPTKSVELGVTLTPIVEIPAAAPLCECVADAVTWLVLPIQTIGVNFDAFHSPWVSSGSVVADGGFITTLVTAYPYNEITMFVATAIGASPSVSWDVQWSGPSATWPDITTEVIGTAVFVKITPLNEQWNFNQAVLTATASCGSSVVGELILDIRGDMYGYY